MASTDGAHQPPNDLHAENMVPLGNLDVSSWWTALQDDSILASADADSLQHIFSRLELFDAMPLGFTCRRLYYHFKESQKRTKALKIVGETREEFKKTGDFSMQNIPVVATFANLRSLVLATCLHPSDFETLFTQLTALPLMSTLIIRALTKEQHGAHLIPGVDACFTHFQLNLPEVSPIEPELLRYITDLHLEVNNSDNHSPASVRFFLFIPHMRNLQKIKLTMGMNMHPIHYPSFLKAVSSLTLLNELDITDEFLDFNTRHTLNEMWPRTAMPVLSSVRFLSMFCLCLGHTPVMERYHLAHCFPWTSSATMPFFHSTSCLRDCDTDFKTCGQKLAQGLAELVPKTLHASYVYQQLAFHFNRDDVALPGFEKFFKESSEEEREHAEKLMKFMNERGGRIVLHDIPKPIKQDWSSGLEAMEAALELEKTVNQSLLDLHNVASSHNDPQMADFIETHYLTEQVEAIKKLSDYVTQLRRVGFGLGEYLFDRHTLGKIKMASTDGAHPSPNDPHAENGMLVEELDVSRWWTALQDESILASYDADCLQHLFSRLAQFDAMTLGFTCRRLYYHFKKFQKAIRVLNLKIKNIEPSFLSEIANADLFVGKFSSVSSKFVATFTNLRSLIVSTSFHPDNFTILLTQLTALPLLNTLNLQVNSSDFASAKTFKVIDFLWHPLAQFQHSSLLHYKVIQALRKDGYGAHLTPGVDACIGLTISNCVFSEPVLIKPELLPFITSLEVPIGYDYNNHNNQKPKNYDLAINSVFNCLPHMCNLQKIKLKMRPVMNSTDYPSFLTALSSLTRLQTLLLEVQWGFFELQCVHFLFNTRLENWLCTDMPVLPRVRDLSLVFVSCVHTNVVEQFHLLHCFPELRQLWCRFEHISDCKKPNENPQYHICGQELARGLIELMPKTIAKKIDFRFDSKFYFSSLENLITESKIKEKLEVANLMLADLSTRNNKCAKLEAENELLKMQLAQTDRKLQEARAKTESANQKLENFKTKLHSLKTENLSLLENIFELQTKNDQLNDAKRAQKKARF
ncbi:fts3-like protein [Tyrophagus putrescentiae]|nr:fts3-like protein [Tyrophagus putrescentiae]